jgi:RNA polymerase sigma-70 factor (ECF subfamily)
MGGEPVSESTSSFQDLIRQVRAGSQEATAELVRQYEPAIRRLVRVQMRDSRLRRLLDSVDVCQSVMANLFTRLAVGQFQLDTPEQLLKLLATMARNELINLAKKEQAGCRDSRRTEGGDTQMGNLTVGDPTPSVQAANKEILEKVFQALGPEERQLWELRQQGHDWAVIAERVGGNPEALRKKLERALQQVRERLGQEGDPGDGTRA